MRSKNWTLLVAGLLLACCLLSACDRGNRTEGHSSSRQSKLTREIYAMDTIMNLTLYGFREDGQELSERELGGIMNQAVSLVGHLEALFSVTEKNSDISKINAADGAPVAVSDETYELLEQCIHYSDRTEGFFDVSVYPLVKLWGFTTGEYRVPTEDEIQEVRGRIDYRKIRLSKGNQVQLERGMQIDLGAAAKGYLSQRLMELFQKSGVESAIVSLGGNVQTMGLKADGTRYRIGIVDPADGTSIYGTLEAENKAVITSGTYQRYFERDGRTYHHIMDKRTGRPAENGLASVTVIAEDGTMGDILATALYVMGEERAVEYQKEHPETDIILIRKDGSLWQSSPILSKQK